MPSSKPRSREGALCGYEGDHDLPSWSRYRWKAQGGYAGQGEGSNDNAARETIWFFPHCLDARQGSLFDRQPGVTP